MSAADQLLAWLQHEDPADTHPDVAHVEACHQLDAKAVADALPAIEKEARRGERVGLRYVINGQKTYRLRGTTVIPLAAVNWILDQRDEQDR